MAKEACEVIKWMAVEFPREFSQAGNPKQQGLKGGGNGVRYFKDDAFFKSLPQRPNISEIKRQKTET